MKSQDPYEYAATFQKTHQPPWLYALYRHWRALFEEPYKGVTTDGRSLSLFSSCLTNRGGRQRETWAIQAAR